MDSNAFVVTKETAEAKNLTSLADLTPDLKVGGLPTADQPVLHPRDPDHLRRGPVGQLRVAGRRRAHQDGARGRRHGGAVLTTTDPSIKENDWVVLEDPEGLINADNIIPVLTTRKAGGREADRHRRTTCPPSWTPRR